MSREFMLRPLNCKLNRQHTQSHFQFPPAPDPGFDMTSLLGLFAMAFGLGMLFNAAPGAVFAETIRRSLDGGYQPALAVQFGSLVGDAAWAILGLAGIGILLQSETLKVPVGIGGAAYLAWLAYDSWRDSATQPSAPADGAGNAALGAMRSGVVLSLSNPQNVAYWAALGSAFGALGVTDPDRLDYALFFAGFMASSVLWCFVCASAVSWLFAGRGGLWRVWTYRLCALAFAWLAVGTARETLRLMGI
jgi:chemosensory pili system protein ChpE/L-lysine exporter family protein LysE/ArgO